MKLRNRSASSSAAAKLESWAEARNAIADGRYWIGPSGRRSRWRKLLFNGLVALFTKGIRLTPLYERGRRNALNLRVVELEVTLPELPPKFDGCRILHVSDSHLDIRGSIDTELVPPASFDLQRVQAARNAARLRIGTPQQVGKMRSVGHEPAGFYELSQSMKRRQLLSAMSFR